MYESKMPTVALQDSFNDITDEGTKEFAEVYQQRMGYAANQNMREPDPTRRPLSEEEMRQEDHDITPDYEIGDRLGRGGCAVVYEGWRNTDHFHVAIKQLAIPATSDHEEVRIARKRFYREAKLIASLHEDHIVQCVDYGVMGENQPCMVLEYIKGRELGDYMQDPENWKDASNGENYLSIEKSVDITIQVLEGLRVSHARTIIHRDIKPGNIMVLDDSPKDKPIIKVLDFGIATVIDSVDNSNTLMTQAGNIRGTPSYMAPELFTGAARASVDSDLYAVGLVLLECLTNRVTFEGQSFMQVAYMQVNEDPEIPSYIPECLAAIIRKATSKKKEDRYQSASDMIRDLQNSLDSAVQAYPKCRTTFLNQKAPSRLELYLKAHKKNIISIIAIIALVVGVTVITQFVFAPKPDDKLIEHNQETEAALEAAKAENAKLAEKVEQAKAMQPVVPQVPGSDLYEEQLQFYCDAAVKCKAFPSVGACKDRYKALFEKDNGRMDCTGSHVLAIGKEMKYVNDMVKVDTCRTVEMYEKAIRLEDIFAQTNGIEEFSSKLLDATSGKNGNYHQVIVMTAYFTVVGKSPDDITGYSKDWGNYQTCRMMQSM